MIGILNVIKDFNFNCRNSCLLAFYTHKLFVNRTSWPYDWHPGPPRGSVGHGAKYLFGGPDDVIMYSNGTRVYWKRGRILRSSALKSSDCIFRGAPGPFPRNIFEFRVSEIAFPAFCEHFWAKSNDLIKSRFLRGPSQVGGQGNLAPPPPPAPPLGGPADIFTICTHLGSLSWTSSSYFLRRNLIFYFQRKQNVAIVHGEISWYSSMT